MPADLDVVTTYMEMTERPTRPTVPCPPGQYAVLRLERPSVTFYRYLYSQVGERWMWSDRRKMSDETLDAAINAEGIEIYVLYAGGEPAGYVELDRRAKPDIRIAYFGLAPFFIGRGLGRYLLNWAVDLAWSYGPRTAAGQHLVVRPPARLRQLSEGRLPSLQAGARQAARSAARGLDSRRRAAAARAAGGTVMSEPRLQRVADQDRRLIEITVDGWAMSAMEGDTVLVAILAQRGHLRDAPGEPMSAGFCLMGACQDCWIWDDDGRRLRACTTYAEPGMRIRTTWPDRLLAS